MSLTVSQYRQTGSDSLLMESRQISSMRCHAQRERERERERDAAPADPSLH